jgi:pimeloyl-ACP methyl ester carboxylesterase
MMPAVRYIDAGTSLLERTVHEIRCVVSYLKSRDDVDGDRIDLVGFGTGGFVALMAAALEPAVRSVVAVGGVTTQQAAIEAELFDHYFLYQPGLAPVGDVGAALSLLAPRPCRMILFDDDLQWPRRGAEDVQRVMQAAYAKAGGSEHFELCSVAGEPAMDDQLTDKIVQWLR